MIQRQVFIAWSVSIGLLVLTALIFALAFIPARPSAVAPAAPAAPPPSLPSLSGEQQGAAPSGLVRTPSGLQYLDEVVGTGPTPQPGQTVVVHYRGWLDNGTEFDSSYSRGQPYEVRARRWASDSRLGGRHRHDAGWRQAPTDHPA